MESRQLRYFLAVAEELHFGRAAKRLCIAQPPLSQQIRNLENDLGVRLFVRTSRRVELTQEGKALMEQARHILDATRRAEEMMRAMAMGQTGAIGIGFVGPALEAGLAGAIRSFYFKYPGIRLVLEESSTNLQLEKIGSGELDIGHVRLFRQTFADFELRLIFRDNYVLALSREHALAKKKHIRLADLDSQPFISFPKTLHPVLHDEIFKSLSAAGAMVNVVLEAKRKSTILSLVAADIGVALLPASTCRHCRVDVLCREIAGGNLPVVEIFQVWQKGRESEALKRFLQYTRSLFES